MIVSELIVRWYKSNKRFLPWREDLDPYKIWLSEIILQQTRVSQGSPYYVKFIESYPAISDLAAASIEDILLLWQGLGYYSRARNLHKAANIIVREFSSIFPDDYESIRSLPGIGDYTAAAIASLAFDLPYAAIDGNVYRLLARILGIEAPTDTTTGKKIFQKAADELLDKKNPGIHNQAMIELGALVCLPLNPKCNDCPLVKMCYAFNHDAVGDYPVRSKRSILSERFLYYLVIRKDNSILIRQRSGKDIWALLSDFPVIERKEPQDLSDMIHSLEWKKIFGNLPLTIRRVSGEYKHILSHQKLFAKFIEIEMDKPDICFPGLIKISLSDLEKYPFPRLLRRYLEKYTASV
jgi:A/G-specific adenine glycosylase